MIINLINTILIACGMAVNTTNFNSIEKPTRRNAAEDLAINETIQYNSPVQSIRISTNPSEYAYKYELQFGHENYQTRYLNIQDTVYSFSNDSKKNWNLVALVKITNYFNSEIRFALNVTTNIVNSASWQIKDLTNVDMNQYYNMTLTANAESQIYEIMGLANNYPNQKTGTDFSNINYTLQSNEYILHQGDQIQLYYHINCWNGQGNITQLRPESINYSGYIIAIDNHTEILDVPGLMFTVLTLPFSFISQAFNLTIFPDTPYQVNFTNLFLTLISIFLVLWLIKHIFK